MIQVYHDPSCTQPPPSYAVLSQYSTCTSSPAHLYQRGAKVGVGQYWVQYSDGSCNGPYPAPAVYDFYALGPEVPTSQLVQLQPTAATGASRLTARYFQSADGFRFPSTLHDAVLGSDCYVNSYAPTGAVCAPDAAYAYNFRDAQCQQPVAAQSSTCPAPRVIGVSTQYTCPNDPPRYYAGGGAVASSPLYSANGASCIATTASAGYTYYGLGAALAIAALTRAPDTAAGHRLQLIHDTADGVRVRDYALWDSMKLTECYPNSGADGTTRCLPASAYATTYYSDAQCRNPIDLAEVPGGAAGCAAPTPPRFASKYTFAGCTSSQELHPIANAYSGPVYANYGSCVPYTPYGKLYAIGAAVPATDFMSATTSTDP